MELQPNWFVFKITHPRVSTMSECVIILVYFFLFNFRNSSFRKFRSKFKITYNIYAVRLNVQILQDYLLNDCVCHLAWRHSNILEASQMSNTQTKIALTMYTSAPCGLIWKLPYDGLFPPLLLLKKKMEKLHFILSVLGILGLLGNHRLKMCLGWTSAHS